MSVTDHPSVRDALQKDDMDISNLLREILKSEVDKLAVLNLRNDDALAFLNLIQNVCLFLRLRESLTYYCSNGRSLTNGDFAILMMKILLVKLIAS